MFLRVGYQIKHRRLFSAGCPRHLPALFRGHTGKSWLEFFLVLRVEAGLVSGGTEKAPGGRVCLSKELFLPTLGGGQSLKCSNLHMCNDTEILPTTVREK